MAVKNITSPAALNFAGNPIIVGASTNISTAGSEYSFLRIICKVDIYTEPNQAVPTFSVELSQPVADQGSATFNLSDLFNYFHGHLFHLLSCTVKNASTLLSYFDKNLSE